MKNSKVINVIKVIGFCLLYLISINIFAESIIVKFVDNIKIRNILFFILCAVSFLIIVMLLKAPKVIRLSIGALWIIIILIGGIVSSVSFFRKSLELPTVWGNNSHSGYYSNGIGDKGYKDIESACENAQKWDSDTRDADTFSNLEEIYRIQAGEYIFVYFKENEKNIVEFELLKQDDLYYCLGRTYVYVSINIRTAEETIRADIASTMCREVKWWDEKGFSAPAWGISTDENIFSMTINSKNVDDIILINEIGGKKYYFWITTNVDGIESIDDVIAAEIKI